jgi:hypothetical protein
MLPRVIRILVPGMQGPQGQQGPPGPAAASGTLVRALPDSTKACRLRVAIEAPDDIGVEVTVNGKVL